MRLSAALVILLLSLISPSTAQEGPPSEFLSHQIQDTLPPFWSLDELRIIAATNLGDVVEPNIKQRFEAVVSPRRDLFLSDESSLDAYGPFLPVLPTATAGTERVLYGIATSTYKAGQWTVALEFENAVAGLGMPADLFHAPIVVRGSEEEGRLRERLRADVAERLRHELAAELERMTGEHQARLRAVQEEHEKELAATIEEHERKIAELQAQLAKGEAEAEAAHLAQQLTSATLLDSVKSNFATELADLKTAHDKAKAALQATQADELEQLRREWDLAVAKAEEDAELSRKLTAIEREKHAAQQKLLEELQQTAEVEKTIAAERKLQEQARDEEEAAAEAGKLEEQARRSAATREALRQRLAALESALRGEDVHLAAAAFSEAVQSNEEALHTAALRLAFESKAATVMQMALGRILENIDTLGASYSAAIPRYKNETFGGAFTLHIQADTAKNPKQNFKGTIRGVAFDPRYFEGDVLELSLNGTSLSGASKNCSLSASLIPQAGRFEGTMQCANVSTPGRGREAATFAIAVPVI